MATYIIVGNKLLVGNFDLRR